MEKNNKIKWVSFQSLIGGMMIGAEKAFGCPPVCEIDYDGVKNSDLYVNYMRNVRKINLPHLILNGNLLSNVHDFKDKVDMSLLKDVDVVCGVPICSGLSPANTVNDKSRACCCGSDAIQNNNMLGMLDFTLNAIKPKAYIFENAYKLGTGLGEGIRNRLFALCEAAGYASTVVKVNTINHGSPQNRPRTFFVACKGTSCPKFTLNKKDIPTIMSIIGDLKGQKGWSYNEKELNENPWYQFVFNYFKKAPDWRYKMAEIAPAPDDMLDSQEMIDFAKPFFKTEKQKKHINHIEKKWQAGKHWMSDSIVFYGDYKLPCLYGHSIERLIHPVENRSYSLRELMRFMGLPDDYEEPSVKNVNMLCQNVPVMTSQCYCAQIMEFLAGKREKSDEKIQNLSKI